MNKLRSRFIGAEFGERKLELELCSWSHVERPGRDWWDLESFRGADERREVPLVCVLGPLGRGRRRAAICRAGRAADGRTSSLPPRGGDMIDVAQWMKNRQVKFIWKVNGTRPSKTLEHPARRLGQQ